jgi:hypothetical protein
MINDTGNSCDKSNKLIQNFGVKSLRKLPRTSKTKTIIGE